MCHVKLNIDHIVAVFATKRKYFLYLSDHKCIVQSYLQWLQDSDYSPNCRLCNNPLISQDTVRLVCYGKIVNILDLLSFVLLLNLL